MGSGSWKRTFALALTLALVGCLAGASSASALTTIVTSGIATPSDARNDQPVRSGTWTKVAYGPYVVSPNSEIKNAAATVTPPCTNCSITDIVPQLEYGSSTGGPFGTGAPNGTVANLDSGAMLHHILMLDTTKQDATCPAGFYGGAISGERWFAAGNERSHVHLPNGFGYPQGPNSTLVTHVVNRAAAAKTLWIVVTFRHVSAADPVRPIWLDIDGMGSACGDSEYTIPTGYSDTHQNWVVPSTINGRFVTMMGHTHDVDITGPGSCTPPGHCPEKGHGIAVNAEVLGGPGSDYYGPNPPTSPCTTPGPRCNSSPPADLTGANLCRSEGYYGTSFGATEFAGHLDTMSGCGVFSSVPVGAQAEAYPAGGAYPPADGYKITSGQTIRVHSEYQNNTGASQTDVMGIIVGYLSPKEPGYPRAKAATPMYLSLVQAYNACTTPNRQHAPTLNYPSCAGPTRTSGFLTSGNPPAQGANFVGSVKYVVTNGGGANDADVNLNANITDVRNAGSLSDYAGELEARTTIRVTDRNNGPAEVGTGVTTDIAVTVPCTTTPTDATVGSTCSVATTANTVAPGFVREDRRMIMEQGQAKVFDGGPDGVASTPGNTLFAIQGVFVP